MKITAAVFLSGLLAPALGVPAAEGKSGQRPALIFDPGAAPGVGEKLRHFPHSFVPDLELTAAISGDPSQQHQASARFVSSWNRLRAVLEAPNFNGVTMRRVSEALYRYDLIDGFNGLTDEERRQFRAIIERAVRRFIGPDPSRFLDPTETNNIWLDGCVSTALAGLEFPEIPESRDWVDYGLRTVRFQLDNAVWDGAWNESPRYHTWALLILAHFLSSLEHRAGIDLWGHPNLRAMLEWSIRFSTPRDRVAGRFYGLPDGVPLSPAYGDANFGNEFATVFALYAPHYAKTDAAFSRRLMYFWRLAGSPNQTGWSYGINFPLIADPTLPDAPQPPLQSAYSPSMGHLILRSGSSQPGEEALFLKGGQPGVAHARSDLGGLNIVADGAPLALGSQSGPYGSKEHETWHRSAESENTVIFGGHPAHRYAPGRVVGFGSGEDADYAVIDLSFANGVERYRRHIVFVKPDYFVVWDEIRSSVSSRWLLHTPAARIEWSDHRIISHTPWGTDLDISVLLPAGKLQANEAIGRFGEWPAGFPERKRDPYPFGMQKYFSIPSPPDVDDLMVLQPRKASNPGLRAELVKSDASTAEILVSLEHRADHLELSSNGATVQRGSAPRRKFTLLPWARDISAQLDVRFLPPLPDGTQSGRFLQRVRIVNRGGDTEGPIWIALDRLPAGVSVANAEIATECPGAEGLSFVFLTGGIRSGSTGQPAFRFTAADPNVSFRSRIFSGGRY